MEYQIKSRFPLIETEYNPVKTTNIIFTGNLSAVVQRWRDDLIKDMLNNKVVLITGGTGSFGKKFVEVILRDYPQVKKNIYMNI